MTIVDNGNVVIDCLDKTGNIDTRQKACSAVMHRSLRIDPLRVVSAKGHYLELESGQKVFDASGGAAVACLGHGNERILEAVVKQMAQVSYCHSMFYSTSAAEELARLLIDSTGGELERAFFISSGSEAMESALKLARQYHLEKKPAEPSRVHFIARQQSYHGTTLGALGVGGHVSRRALFEPMLSSATSRVSPCYAYRKQKTGESDQRYVQRLELELDQEFQRVGPHTVAAFIAEPVVGAAMGCVPSVPGYFAAVRKVCDRYGALLIFDEIMCGVGRVGPRPSQRFLVPLHAWQDASVGVTPDLMTLGKGLGGGYMPIAAMLAGRKVVDVLGKGSSAFSHGQTYQAHPVACRAALEVQTIIKDSDLIANVRVCGELLGRLLKESLENHPAVGNIRGDGFFWGIEFVKDKQTKEPYERSEGIAMALHELGLREPYNISLYPGSGTVDGQHGDHVLIAPAYNTTSEEVATLVELTVRVITDFFNSKR